MAAALALFCIASVLSLFAPAVHAASSAETIVVYADRDVTRRPMQGFLYSGNDLNARLVEPLKIRYWRTNFSAKRGTYDLFKSIGARVTFVLSDSYAQANGGYANLKPWQDWTAYENFVRRTVKQTQALGLRFDYWDIWNEPNNFWHGTDQQFFELMSRTIAVLRSVDPTAKVTVPSQSGINDAVLDFMLHYLWKNGIGPQMNAMSWHEFGLPENIPGHVHRVRTFFQNHAADFCQPRCPEIHINEFSSGQHDAIPGWALGWLYYLEQADVDWASKACWQIIGGRYNTYCLHGLGGLFTEDGAKPQHAYWVYRGHAELPSRRLQVDIPAARTVALAGRDDANQELRILVGRYSCGKNGRWCKFSDRHASDTPNAPADINLRVQGYPFAADRVEVRAVRIPNQGIPGTLTAPLTLPSWTVAARQGAVDLRIDGVGDGDAYLLVLRPR